MLTNALSYLRFSKRPFLALDSSHEVSGSVHMLFELQWPGGEHRRLNGVWGAFLGTLRGVRWRRKRSGWGCKPHPAKAWLPVVMLIIKWMSRPDEGG